MRVKGENGTQTLHPEVLNKRAISQQVISQLSPQLGGVVGV